MSRIVINIDQSESNVFRWSRVMVWILGSYAVLGGLISFGGWFADVRQLTDWLRNGISIQPNAAIAALCSGTAILLFQLGFRRFAIIFGCVVWLIGLTALFQIATNFDLGINTPLMFGRDWGSGLVTSPGRMGTPGAVSWSLIGISLTLLTVNARDRYEVRSKSSGLLTVGTALATLAISTLSITGYLYGAAVLYALPSLTVIALQTATFVFSISLAIIFCVPDSGPMRVILADSVAGSMMRRIVPAVIVIPLLLGSMRIAGERAEFYDVAFGSAVRSLAEIGLFLLLLWWVGRAVTSQERRAEVGEQAARENAVNLVQLSDAMPQVVWIADDEGRVNYVNQRIDDIAGTEEVDGFIDWRSALHADDLDQTLETWQKAIREGSSYTIEHRFLMADGTYRWHLSRALPVTDPEGHAVKWYGTATDIHELKLAQDTSRIAEERLRRALDAGDLGTWEIDPVNKRVLWDQRTKHLFGITPDAEVTYGQTMWLAIPEDEHPMVRAATKKALDPEGDGVFDLEHRVQLVDGSIRWLRNLGQAEFRGTNSTRAAVLMRGTVADITDQKEEETRFALLARLGDLIRTTEDPASLLYAVAKSVGDTFNVSRCFFSRVNIDAWSEVVDRDYCRGVSSIAGEHNLLRYGPLLLNELRSGKTVVNADARRDPRTRDTYAVTHQNIGERSFIAVPLMRGGVWVALLWISDNRPRTWSSAEVRVIESIGERTWLAIEKVMSEAAMRESAARLNLAMQVGDYGTWDIDYQTGSMIWSDHLFHLFGLPPTDGGVMRMSDYESLGHPVEGAFIQKLANETANGTDGFSGEYRIQRVDNGEDVWINAAVQLFYDTEGQPARCVGVAQDVTERKLSEERLKMAHQKLEDRVVERTTELAASNIALKEEMGERQVAERQRIELLHRLISSQEVERRRIARDIHDQLGQRLTALRLKIASLKEATAKDDEIGPRVDRLQDIAEKLDSEVSFLAWELRPTALDDLGLVEAVEAFVNEWSKHAEIDADFHSGDFPADRLDREVESHLYRITQEALNNIAKHARAKHVTVLLERRDKNILLIVEDDGVGFDPAAKRKAPDGSSGLGVIGMGERASLVGGEIEFESAPGKGTTIYVRVPFLTK